MEDSKSNVPKLLEMIVLVGVVSIVIIFFLVLSSEEEGVVRDFMLQTPLLQDMVTRKTNEIEVDSFEDKDILGELDSVDEALMKENEEDIANLNDQQSDTINIGIDGQDEQVADSVYLSPSEITREGEKAFLSLRLKDARNIFLKNQSTDPVSNFYLGLISSFEHDLNSTKAYFSRVRELSGSELMNVKAKEILKSFDEYNLYPGSTEDHLEVLLGRAYINLGFPHLGIVKLKDAVKLNPNYKDAYVILGAAYMVLEEYDEAINYLTKAIPTDRPEPNYYLGLAYFNLEKYYEAVLSFREASDLGYHPEVELRKKLGESLLAIGKYQESMSEFERVIDINPLDPNAYYQPVWISLSVDKNAQKALSYSELCISNNPKSALCNDYLGWVYLEASQFEMAKKYLDAAINIDPSLGSAYFHLARYYEAYGDFNSAQSYYRKVLEVSPGSEYSNDAEIAIKKYL